MCFYLDLFSKRKRTEFIQPFPFFIFNSFFWLWEGCLSLHTINLPICSNLAHTESNFKVDDSELYKKIYLLTKVHFKQTVLFFLSLDLCTWSEHYIPKLLRQFLPLFTFWGVLNSFVAHSDSLITVSISFGPSSYVGVFINFQYVFIFGLCETPRFYKSEL